MMRRWLPVLLLLLTACATPPQLAQGRLTPPAGQGYVIAALTLDSLNHRHADAGLCLQGPRGERCLQSQISLGFIRAPGQESDGVGDLHVLALPAGEYRVSELYGSWLDDSFPIRTRPRAHFALNERFSLAAGQVLYLGEYHVSLNYQPSYWRADTARRDFNDLRERSGVTDFSNITRYPLPAKKNTQ